MKMWWRERIYYYLMDFNAFYGLFQSNRLILMQLTIKSVYFNELRVFISFISRFYHLSSLPCIAFQFDEDHHQMVDYVLLFVIAMKKVESVWFSKYSFSVISTIWVSTYYTTHSLGLVKRHNMSYVCSEIRTLRKIGIIKIDKIIFLNITLHIWLVYLWNSWFQWYKLFLRL